MENICLLSSWEYIISKFVSYMVIILSEVDYLTAWSYFVAVSSSTFVVS